MSAHMETGNKAIRFAVVEQSPPTASKWGPAYSYHQDIEGALKSWRTGTKDRQRNAAGAPPLVIVGSGGLARLPRQRRALCLVKAVWHLHFELGECPF